MPEGAARPPLSARRRGQRAPHQLAFTLHASHKSPVAAWTASVASFFATTLRLADAATYKAFSRDSPNAAAPAQTEPEDSSLPLSRSGNAAHQIDADAVPNFESDADPDNNNNIDNDADADGPSAAASSETIDTSGRPTSARPPQLSEPLETLAVHCVVQLISILGHFAKPVRVGSAALIYDLASIFDRSLIDKDLEPILMDLESSEKGYYTCVHELFQITGSSFSSMVLAMVAGLECFHDSSDWRVRGICNAALARLVFENEQTFLQEDHLSAIWNLYFSLSSIPLISTIFPDRIVILDALHLLAPIYTTQDTTLACAIVDSLLRMRNKTASETETIRSILTIIIERLCKHCAAIERGGSGAPSAMASGGLHDQQIGYGLFLDLVSPHDEFAYDLFPWTLEIFTLNLFTAQTGVAKTIPIPWFSALNNFIVSLSNHFRAAPPLVRYGAGLALHCTLKLCPTFLSENKQIWPYVVAGVLDTDYLTAFLFLSILDMNEMPDAPEIRRVIARLRRTGGSPIGYDTVFVTRIGTQNATTVTTETDANGSTVKELPEITRGDLLDLVVKYSPPLSPLLLHKLANSLDYVPVKVKLRQLELIRIWGKKAEKLDTFLMQMLLPLCGSDDERVRLETLRVIQAMIPGFSTASQTDIAFVWSYLSTLLDPGFTSPVLKAILNIIKTFPLLQLNSVSREELVNCLFRLIFYRDAEVRSLVYTIIGGAYDFWKITGQMNEALAVLFLAIGDDNLKCAQTVIDQIQHLGSQTISQMLVQLGQVRDSLTGSTISRIRAYDQLATSLALHKSDYRPLVDAMLLHERVDRFWSFYIGDVLENQLARPDDYNYSRNFIQSPFWIGLLLTKFSCTPPPPVYDPNARRDAIPTTPAGKRRYICGFMACLLPMSGMPDMTLRRASCIALVRSCFKNTNINPGMLRGLLEYVSQQMLTHKNWSYQVSAIDIIGLIVRLKVPGISESIYTQYLDIVLEFLHNTSSPIIKVSVVAFLEILLMMFPKALSARLQDIRDLTRTLLVDKDLEVAAAASRIYPLVFRAVGKGAAKAFHQYLTDEIMTILSGGPSAAGDPLVSNLTLDESKRVVEYSILCIGMINEGVGSTYAIAQTLMRFAAHDNPRYRAAALTAILSLLHTMDQQESSSVIWMLLPLYADPNCNVRLLFSRFLRNLPSMVQSRCQGLPPHPEDTPILPITSWEEILTDTATITVANKSLQELLMDIDALNPHPFTSELPPEDDGLHLPTVSEKLMSRYKVLAQSTTTTVSPTSQSEVVYFLQEMQKQPLLRSNAIIVLSEFCCQHELTFGEISDTLVNHLSQELTSDNTALVESCVLGLYNIVTTHAHTFKLILNKIMSAAVLNEGDLVATLFMSELIRSVAGGRVADIIARTVPIITSQRHALKKRIYAVYLAVDVSLFGGPDEIKTVLDSVNTLLDGLEDKQVRHHIQQTMSRILAETGPKHPLFRNMIQQAKRDVKSKLVTTRLDALHVFSMFAPHMSMEDCMWFVFHFLADSCIDVRTTAREVITQGKMIEFAFPTLQRTVAKTGRRADLLAGGRLPSLVSVGVTAVSTESLHASDNDTTTVTSTDAFNTKYYASTRRAKFSAMYGLPESGFAKLSEPATVSVLSSVEARASNTETVTTDTSKKTAWLLKLDPITILHDLIGLYPSVASELIEYLLVSVENMCKMRGSMGSTELLSKSGGSQASLLTAPGGNGGNASSRAGTPNAAGTFPGTKTGTPPAASAASTQEDSIDINDIEAVTHKIDVLSNLLLAHDGIGKTMTSWGKRLQNTITAFNTASSRIRETLYHDMEHSFYFYNEFLDVPVISDEQFDTLEDLRETTHEATFEIVKSGKTDQLSILDAKRLDMNDTIDTKSEQLRRITIVTLHLVSAYGLLYALSTSSQAETLVEAFHFLAEMLDKEHRGLRIAAVEALVIMVQLQTDDNDDGMAGRHGGSTTDSDTVSEFIDRIDAVVGDLVARLRDDYQSLFRRKADYAMLISQLLICLPSRDRRLEALRMFVHMWRDPDSEVRITSIRMVQAMGEAGVPEVLMCFEPDTSLPGSVIGAVNAGGPGAAIAASIAGPVPTSAGMPQSPSTGAETLTTSLPKPQSVHPDAPISSKPVTTTTQTQPTQQQPVQIMKELARLVSNEDYDEKDILQDLLKWRFAQSASQAAQSNTSKPGTTDKNGLDVSGARSSVGKPLLGDVRSKAIMSGGRG